MVVDFRETLEVSKNSTCFLSYSWCRTKEDLAEVSEDTLPNPPMEIEFEQEDTLAEVTKLIEDFCETSDKAEAAMQRLLNTGKVTITEEY